MSKTENPKEPKIYTEPIEEKVLEVGDLVSDEVYNFIKKKHYKTRGTSTTGITLGDDYQYLREEIEGDIFWRVISNFRSRVDGVNTGGYIYSFERKKSKAYYDKKGGR